MARVLLVGYIPELLQDPEHLLRSAGHDVAVATSFATASAAIGQGLVGEQGPIDVAVLNFSIPEHERNQLAHTLRKAIPSVKIIMIYFASLKNTEFADAIMPTTASAEDVLRAVHHLLNNDRSQRA